MCRSTNRRHHCRWQFCRGRRTPKHFGALAFQEEPVARGGERIPGDSHSLSVIEVLENCACCLDPHNGNRLSADIERQSSRLYETRLDCDPVTRLHAANKFRKLVLISV